MSIRSNFARLLVPLFVAALMAASAAPVAANHTIAHGGQFLPCGSSNPDKDVNNCIVSFQVNGSDVAGGVEGPVDDSGLELDVFFSLDDANDIAMLQVQVNNLANGSDQERFELKASSPSPSITASDTVTIVIKVTEDNFTPFFLVGAGVISTWEWDATDDELTVVVKPAASTFAIPGTLSSPTSNSCPSSSYDQGGECETADVDYDSAILLAADDLPTTAGLTAQGVPADQQQGLIDQAAAYTGGFVATDAQEFAIPSFDTSTDPPTVFFDLSAAHFMSDGVTQNEGFFNVLLTEGVFDQWGMTFDQNSPPSIDAAADGSGVSLQAPVFFPPRSGFDAGWLIKSNTISYSSPTITLAPGSSSSVTEPTEFDLSSGGTTPASTRLPVALPDTGEVTRQVTLQGSGATLVMPQGTMVTLGGVPFTGTIQPPTRVQGRPAGLRSAVSITASGGSAEADSLSAKAEAATLNASARSAYALADDELVFDPPVTITITDTSAAAAESRVVRIAPDGSITDQAGTMTGRGVQAEITGLGTYGLATELDLAKITSAPSISVALPVALPSDGVIDFPTTLNGDTSSVTFAAGTAVTDASGEAFAGRLEAPTAATAPSGTGSAVDVATSDGTKATFTPAATLTLTTPEGTLASEVGVVEVTSATATSCLAALATDDGITEDATTVEVGVAGTGTFGLALPVTADATLVERDWAAADGHHSQWAGQSGAPSLCAGQVATISVLIRNTGMTTWEAGSATAVVLATNAPPGNTVAIDSGLVVAPLYESRLATHEEATVAPGAVGTFNFKVRAPAEAGTYRIDVRPVAERLQWLEDEGIFLEILVR